MNDPELITAYLRAERTGDGHIESATIREKKLEEEQKSMPEREPIDPGKY
jgi:hypothetical protein